MKPFVTVEAVLGCCILLFLSDRQVDAGAVCTEKHSRPPNLQDCLHLYNELPFTNEPDQGELTAPRAFVEPQFLFSPFCSVRNPYPQTTMVQLPKIWRMSRGFSGWN